MTEDKETTKVRIVYYSVTIYGGMSHNNMLPGPKLSKMFFLCAIAFPQLSCGPCSRSDGNFLTSYHGKERRRVPALYRRAEVYEAMSLTFDDRVSLYLAQYVVRKHAEDNRNDHPLAIAIILLQVYVGDIMTSLSTNDDHEAIKAQE